MENGIIELKNKKFIKIIKIIPINYNLKSDLEKKKIENNKKYNIEIIKKDLQEKYFKIKECLLRCGNLVTEISDVDECNKIIYSFINTRKYLNNM